MSFATIPGAFILLTLVILIVGEIFNPSFSVWFGLIAAVGGGVIACCGYVLINWIAERWQRDD